MSKIIEELEKEQMTKDIPDFSPGDSVAVQSKLKKAIERDFKHMKA